MERSINNSYELELSESADMILYEVVNSLLSCNEFQDFCHHVSNYDATIKFKEKNVVWYPPLLIFPKEELSGCCSEEEKKLPFLVAGCFNSRKALGESGIVEDNFVFRYYYTAGWNNTDGKKRLSFYEQRRVNDTDIPVFKDNVLEFTSAIEDLIIFIQKFPDINQKWEDRFNRVLEMIHGEADCKRIFLFAGLYDIDSLWKSLEEFHSACCDELSLIKSNFTQQLHRYVMFHVNSIRMTEVEEASIDYNNTGVVSSNLDIHVSRPEEYKWLRYIHEKSLPEFIKEPTYVRDFLQENWENDVDAMQNAFNWNKDEQHKLTEALDKGTEEHIELLRQLVRKRLRQEAVKEFEDRKMQWMYMYNR